ncbi:MULTISPECIES: FAD-dependent monooxygenase [Streptomyces]|uniref:FAD-dependent monooxygenase n=1 Tax=Streptomyces TaxID=1883 RepID=UPI000D509A9D|nr:MULTISPECIES: FAD-dependent monooxygenase [Streptomyces]MXG24757.1 pentachlorophenol monooxygenase [Streptomyces sp. YIM 132580]PVC72862.1 pentachlorophenol monooxygenase [Streptomyces sp. CS065A]
MELNSVKERAGGPGPLPSRVEVLIVGAGPSGLALAVDLARRGVPALVVERAAALFPGSRGKGVQPRTREVFDDLGVGEAVRSYGGTAPVGMVWADGTRQGPYDMFRRAAPTEAEPYGEPWLLPQWRTQEILLARLRELGGDVAFSTALTSLTQDADGVTAELTTGSVRASWLVAADGGRSTVRRALGVGMTGGSVDPAPMLVADVRIAASALDRDNWHIFTGDVGHTTLCPLPGTADFQLVAQFQQGAPDLAPEAVRALVADRTHLAAGDVTEVRWSSDFRPRAALADRFRAGRVLLMGDAAHIHSPAGGQGLNTSVQDAYNLGWKLGQVLLHGAPEALIDSYEQERRPVAEAMLGLSTRIHQGRQERGRDTQQLGLGYRGGPLSAGRAGALEAGDRAPDGPAGARGRLFDVFRGPHFTLLALGTDAALPSAADASVRTYRGTAQESYGSGLFLVRPDGYIGWAGQEPSGLTAYGGRVGLGLTSA